MLKSIAFLTVFLATITGNIAQTLKDADGNVYNTVTIGTQIWMKENLKVTHYLNGDPIPEIKDSLDWVIQTSGAWCNNQNNPNNGAIYGKLYNWFVINDPRGISPVGWHVPTDDEWKTLEKFVGMPASLVNLDNYRGTNEANALKVKDTTTYWTLDCCPAPGLSKNKGTNSSGFSALGAGYRIYMNAGGSYTSFQIPTGNAQFWTSTSPDSNTAWLRHLCVYHEDIYRSNWPKVNGSSIRLIKDTPATSTSAMQQKLNASIHPNPVQQMLHVDNSSNEILHLQIINMFGECLYQTTCSPKTCTIDLSNFPKGLYYLKLNNSQSALIEKIIKE